MYRVAPPDGLVTWGAACAAGVVSGESTAAATASDTRLARSPCVVRDTSVLTSSCRGAARTGRPAESNQRARGVQQPHVNTEVNALFTVKGADFHGPAATSRYEFGALF